MAPTTSQARRRSSQPHSERSNGPGTLDLDGPVTSFGATLNLGGGNILNVNSTFPAGGGAVGAANLMGGTINLGANNWNPTTLTVGNPLAPQGPEPVIDMAGGTIAVSGLLTFTSNTGTENEFIGLGNDRREWRNRGWISDFERGHAQQRHGPVGDALGHDLR